MATRRHWIWVLGGLSIGIAGGVMMMTNAQPSKSPPPRFAEDRDPPTKLVPFDKTRAMKYLQQICDLGPRISGTEGMQRQQELLKKHFESFGARVELQRFPAKQRSQRQSIEMANLIARWHPERNKRIILCAHYDTRPIADKEPDVRRWRLPFLAANDGASGPALMMEMTHSMANLETAVGIDFVLFDGEEYVFDGRPTELGGDLYFFGSEHFAREYQQRRQRDPKSPTYAAAVLVDMIAGKNARFYYEQYSWTGAGHLAEEIWTIARQLGIRSFIPEIKHEVRDDHLALLRVRIPAIDIIDFDYPHWHRLSDVPANCSGDSMEQVARVVAVWMQRVK